jgi:pheromone shutdown protein TraB
VLELESLDRQLSLLDRLPEPDRWRFLDEMMATIVSGAQRTEARAMVQAWSTADRDALDRIAARCDADASVSGTFVNRVLLKERNVDLAESLLQLLRQENRTFAAVGVLHLLGSGQRAGAAARAGRERGADLLKEQSKKPCSPRGNTALLKSGGADGTRTRDPRRDRPVF